MSSKSDIPTSTLSILGLGETHPILMAIPVGIVTGVVTLLLYRQYMGSSRQPEHKRVEVERKLEQVVNLKCFATLFGTQIRNIVNIQCRLKEVLLKTLV